MEHLGEKVASFRKGHCTAARPPHGGAAAAHGVRLRAVGFEQAALEGTTADQGGGLENSWLTDLVDFTIKTPRNIKDMEIM